MGRMLPQTPQRSDTDSPANLGSDAAWFTGPSAFGEFLIILALAVLVISGIAVAVISVSRLLRSRGLVPWTSRGPVDPQAAGVLAVALVRQAHVERWIPATVVRLATDGILTVVDHGLVDRSLRQRTFLEFTGDPAAVKALAAGGDVDASLACALFDGAPTQGAQVSAGRAVAMTKPMLSAALSGLARARRAYVDDIHSVLRRWLMIGGVAGLVAGFLLAIVGPQKSSAFLASGVAGLLGGIGLVARWRVPSWRSLNPDGLELRARSRPDRMFPTKVASTTEGEQLAQWAVLFGRTDVLRRYAQLAERGGAGPAWYRGDGAFTARRFTSCIGSISSTLGLRAATAATVLAAAGSAETMTRNYAIIDGWSHSGDGGGGGGDGGGGGGGDGGGGGGGGGGDGGG